MGKLTDRAETVFGIRSITFDARQGFRLNGRTVNLKGGCIHHDNRGPFGGPAHSQGPRSAASNCLNLRDLMPSAAPHNPLLGGIIGRLRPPGDHGDR